VGSNYILGVCDYCANPNTQKLTRRSEEYLCNRCLEDRRRGATAETTIAKRQRDQKFINEHKSIVGGNQI